MELPDGNIRNRRRTVQEVVQNFDAFVKVVDDVKEEKKAANGIRKRLTGLFSRLWA